MGDSCSQDVPFRLLSDVGDAVSMATICELASLDDKRVIVQDCEQNSQVNSHAAKTSAVDDPPAFDAAARHLSFTNAAAELNLTHGAISRAIRNIEDRLGVQLFERGTRSVSLTPAGATYAAEIGAALDRISAATLVATAPRSAGVLNVSTSDGFAGRWLVPRLLSVSPRPSRHRRAHRHIRRARGFRPGRHRHRDPLRRAASTRAWCRNCCRR